MKKKQEKYPHCDYDIMDNVRRRRADAATEQHDSRWPASLLRGSKQIALEIGPWEGAGLGL